MTRHVKYVAACLLYDAIFPANYVKLWLMLCQATETVNTVYTNIILQRIAFQHASIVVLHSWKMTECSVEDNRELMGG